MGLWKRGNIYWAYFYVDGIRHQVSTGTSNQRQAELIFQKLKSEANLGRHQLPKADRQITFEALVARFITEGNPRPHNFGRLDILLPYFAPVPVIQITKALAHEYRRRRQAAASVSDATINRDLAVLRHVLNWGLDEGLLAANPLARLKLARERRTRRPVLSIEEELLLLNVAPEHLKKLIIAALDAGLRRSELFQQQWDDVDFARRLFSVTRSKTPAGEAREIPLTSRLFDLLWETREDDGRVFTFKGQPIGTIKRTWKTTLRRSGIRPLRFHDLRHTFNTRLMEAGVIQDIRKALMGHSSGDQVQLVYTRVELPAKREAIAKLEQWVHKQTQDKLSALVENTNQSEGGN